MSTPRRFTPKITGTQKKVAKPKVAKNVPYFLVYHPERWMVLEGQAVIPALARLSLRNSSNGVRVLKNEKGEIRYACKDAIADLAEQGATTILPEMLGEEGYLLEYDVEGGVYYASPGEVLHAGSDIITCDVAAHLAFVAKCRKAKVFDKPAVHVIQALLERHRRRLDKWASAAAGKPGPASTRAAAEAKAVELLEAELKKLAKKAPRAAARKSTAPAVGEEGTA